MKLIGVTEEDREIEITNLRRCLKKQKYLIGAEGYIAENCEIIKINKNNKTIGFIFLFDAEDNSCLIEFVINPIYRGRGFGKLAIKTFINEWKTGKRIIAKVNIENMQSQRCFDQASFYKEVHRDLVVYSKIV